MTYDILISDTPYIQDILDPSNNLIQLNGMNLKDAETIIALLENQGVMVWVSPRKE